MLWILFKLRTSSSLKIEDNWEKKNETRGELFRKYSKNILGSKPASIREQKFASDSKYILKQTLAISNIFPFYLPLWGFWVFSSALLRLEACFLSSLTSITRVCMYKSICVPIIYLFIYFTFRKPWRKRNKEMEERGW